jgi:integrase/recombinase XerC
VTWSEAVDRFMTSLERAERSQHTTHHYRDDLRAFSTWWAQTSDEVLTPRAISEYDLREWKRHLCEEPLESGRPRKPNAINAKLSALRSFLRWAHGQKVIAEMPETPRRQKIGARAVKWLQPDEQRRLLRQAARERNPRNLPLVEILIETGLRVAELVSLRWDLDVTVSERKGLVEVRKGKGCKPRSIPLSPKARAAFQRLRELEPDAGPGEPVFTSQRKDPARPGRNKPLSIRGVQELLGCLAEKLKWDGGLHPHQLRHTCAMNMAKRGVDWTAIARILGHSSTSTTMDHYGTPSQADLEAAVDPDSGDDDLD